MTTLADLRREYRSRSLTEAGADADAIKQFTAWWDEAISSQLLDVNAMVLATVSAGGDPSARTVLLKEFSDQGFVFFTNYDSAKGRELAANPRACLLFYWAELERQVRITGQVSKVSREESDAYFHSRPFESQIAAWASPQSRPLADRTTLEEGYAALHARYAKGTVPLPPYWGGYLVAPEQVEFWQGRESRLHDRLLYVKSPAGWTRTRLAP